MTVPYVSWPLFQHVDTPDTELNALLCELVLCSYYAGAGAGSPSEMRDALIAVVEQAKRTKHFTTPQNDSPKQ